MTKKTDFSSKLLIAILFSMIASTVYSQTVTLSSIQTEIDENGGISELKATLSDISLVDVTLAILTNVKS